MAAGRSGDPIKRVTLKSGRVRYRFVIDVGSKPDGRRDQRTYTYDSLKEARDERARIVAERAQGTLVKPNRKRTVGEVVAQFLESKADRKPGYLQSLKDALRPVVDRWGALPVQALDTTHLEALRREMRSGATRRIGARGKPLAPRTVNLALGATSMMLKWARKRRIVSHNVAELVDRVPSDPDAGADRSEWQTEDAVAFLRHVQGDRLYAAWFLSLLGLRRGEVLGLSWEDIDLTGEKARERKLPPGTPSLVVVRNRVSVAGKVHVGTPKARRSRRTLPLPEPVVTALRKLKATQASDRLAAGEAYAVQDGRVVVDELGGPWRPQRYSDRFEALVKTAAVRRVPLHGARHAAASLMADLGYPDVVIAAWLGHAQITITHGYTHVMNERMRQASAALGDVLAG